MDWRMKVKGKAQALSSTQNIKVSKKLDGTSGIYTCMRQLEGHGQKSLMDTGAKRINASDIKSIASVKRNASKQLPKYLC